jgi:hypothetical protein
MQATMVPGYQVVKINASKLSVAIKLTTNSKAVSQSIKISHKYRVPSQSYDKSTMLNEVTTTVKAAIIKQR